MQMTSDATVIANLTAQVEAMRFREDVNGYEHDRVMRENWALLDEVKSFRRDDLLSAARRMLKPVFRQEVLAL